MSEFISQLTSAVSSDEEVLILQQLISSLSVKHNAGGSDTTLTGLVDKGGTFDLFGEGNPYPLGTLENICPSQDCLDKFTCYLFDRRFGWSETDTEDGRRVRRMSCSGATKSAGNSKQKAALNTMLDSLIKWFMYQELNQPLLLALKYTIKQTASMPVVRNRAVIHTLDWCKSNAEQLCDTSFFQDIHDLVILSITDVWSAIRNACAGRLGPVAANLNLENVQTLFDSLVKICEEDSSWQMKEGAIMGINAILQRFLKSSSSKSPMSSPRTLDTESQESHLPEFVMAKIHSVVFDLLSHSQLTIREHAAKTLATYITCSSVMDALNTLYEVIQILKKKQDSKGNTQVSKGQFLDDYASEGFLGVCIFLVKVIPLSYLLPGWPEYISTFLLYLSHPASTVRQAASSVFKYLVVKSCHSVVILKLILQALAMGWNPDTDCMTMEETTDGGSLGSATPSVCDFIGTNLSETWEGREGRMFAFELIFRYLIKNHWLYTFGPAGSGLQMEAGASKEQDTKLTQSNIESKDQMQQNRLLHHVESEKSLANVSRPEVRFLTQADLKEDPERLVNNKLERLITVDHEDSTDLIANHLPHRTAGIGPSHSGAGLSNSGAGQNHFDNACSLLTQAQLVDNVSRDGTDPDKIDVKQEQQLKKLTQLMENNNNNKNSTISCKCGWMEKEYLQDMSRILKVILYQTAESLGHSQWELRRIANQVLPCLAEVIRWYDINLLVTVWNSYLNVAVPTCLMTFTSVLLLKESVIHAVKLIPLLHKPPHSWQDHEKCRDYLSKITTTVKGRLPAYLPHLQYLIQRSSYDKLSIISSDVILMAYAHFSVTPEQKSSHYNTVLQFWKQVFYSAHPQTRISTELLHRPQNDGFSSPFEGYLSCCLVKPDNKIQCAKQVEKLFISELYHQFVTFLEGLPAVDVISVSPILAHYIGQFVEDSHISKAMLECLQTSVPTIVLTIEECSEGEKKLQCVKCVLTTLRELSAVIAMKSIDLPQVQKILAVYEELCKPVSINQHMSVALSAIAARLNETVEFTVDQPVQDELYLLSNDIPVTYSDHNSDDDSDPEEVIVGSPGARFPESLMLNTSNNSGSLTGRLSALSCHSGGLEGSQGSATPKEGSDDEGESSDWDSWDDEDESLSAFGDVFSQFLQKLQKMNKTDFTCEVKKLGTRERNVISGLIKT
ncbi:uncharacterized protein LOC132725472 isoform X3 [Ruditapes philippinarum]|uniref:uncharacterized protein LOC132725472 isoform X3 n=1 Tax=Ruditapes philippinarum TaxID=129788 RepID=UPI00295AEB47|nr:uncharacterized protein LOC132725472 isoform X3 [Ruditapes philippinarum]